MAQKGKELVVKYKATDGELIQLDVQTVKQYLVRGKANLVDDQEFMFFCQLCKARKLNPFINDCYLIKYSSDPAAIILSIHYKRGLAKSQPDYRGHQKGIIVETKDGVLKDSYGLLRKGETLLGGWFEAQPENYRTPFRLEVNLDEYTKTTREGDITQFWQKKCTMIAKVAESQGLSALWPKDLGHLYTKEEFDLKGEMVDIESKEVEPEIPPMSQEQLYQLLELLPNQEEQLLFRDFLFERGSIETNQEGQPSFATLMEPVARDLLERWDVIQTELEEFTKRQKEKIDPETYQAFQHDLIDAGYQLIGPPEDGSEQADLLAEKKQKLDDLITNHGLDSAKVKRWLNEKTKRFSGKIGENQFRKLSFLETPISVLQEILDTADTWIPLAIEEGLVKGKKAPRRKPPAS
jgi:phage recombination protein Bet